MQLSGKLSRASIFSEWTNYLRNCETSRTDRSIVLSVKKRFYFWWQKDSI